jgi:hypothetical protein
MKITRVSVVDETTQHMPTGVSQHSDLVTDKKLSRWVREALDDAERLTATTGRVHSVKVTR